MSKNILSVDMKTKKSLFLKQFEQSRKNIEAWPDWMKKNTKMVAAIFPYQKPRKQS